MWDVIEQRKRGIVRRLNGPITRDFPHQEINAPRPTVRFCDDQNLEIASTPG
jgi:hypothetical protein